MCSWNATLEYAHVMLEYSHVMLAVCNIAITIRLDNDAFFFCPQAHHKNKTPQTCLIPSTDYNNKLQLLLYQLRIPQRETSI